VVHRFFNFGLASSAQNDRGAGNAAKTSFPLSSEKPKYFAYFEKEIALFVLAKIGIVW